MHNSVQAVEWTVQSVHSCVSYFSLVVSSLVDSCHPSPCVWSLTLSRATQTHLVVKIEQQTCDLLCLSVFTEPGGLVLIITVFE